MLIVILLVLAVMVVATIALGVYYVNYMIEENKE